MRQEAVKTDSERLLKLKVRQLEKDLESEKLSNQAIVSWKP